MARTKKAATPENPAVDAEHGKGGSFVMQGGNHDEMPEGAGDARELVERTEDGHVSDASALESHEEKLAKAKAAEVSNG